MPQPTPRTSRRDRPAKPPLSRELIVATALQIVRTEGLDKATVRRVAQQLDTGPASLYVYVRNTAELYAAVLDELLGEVDLRPVTARGDWQRRLADLLTSYLMVLFEYPALAQSALVTRPSGPRYLALLDGVLSLLQAGGVPDGQAAWAVDLLLLYATSTAAEQSARHSSIDADDEVAALAEAVRDADPDRYPRIAALGTELLSGTGPQRLSWGFQVLISGILATPRPDSAS